MALMRHRDPKQTAKTYTDARMLPLKEAIEKLDFHRSPVSPKDDTQRDTQNSAAAGQNEASAVTSPVQVQLEESPVFMRSKSLFVTPWRGESKEGKWSERQDSNLRLRGPKPRALARLSYAPTRTHDYKNFQGRNPIVGRFGFPNPPALPGRSLAVSFRFPAGRSRRPC